MTEPHRNSKELVEELESLKARTQVLEARLQGSGRPGGSTVSGSNAEGLPFDRFQLQAILDAVPAASVLVEGTDGRFSMINRLGLVLYGISTVGTAQDAHSLRLKARKLDGTPFSFADFPTSVTLKTGAVIRNQEMVIHRADGEEIPVVVSSAPLYDAQGKIVAAVAIFEDLRALRLIEAELLESHLRQAFLLRLSDALRPVSDPIEIQTIITHLLGEYLEVSHVFYVEVGKKAGQLPEQDGFQASGGPVFTGRSRLHDLGPESMAELRAGKTLAVHDIHEGPALTEEQSKNLASIGIQAHVTVPIIKDGELVALFGINNSRPRQWTFRELRLMEEAADRIWSAVERALAEDSLRQSEEKFRMVLENSQDGINLLDLATGRYVYMSPSQVALTGFTADGIRNFSAEEAYERVHPDDRAFAIEQHKRMVAGQNTFDEVEYRWMVPDGEYRWFLDRRKLVMDEHGQPMAMVIISRDITERKKNEDTLRESEQRALALVEKLRWADQNKNRFLHMLSHELRNPLAAIVMSLNLLEQVPSESNQATRARQIMTRQANQLTRLVDDLLDVTRISENKIRLKTEKVDLIGLVQKAIADTRDTFSHKEIELAGIFPTEPLCLEADPQRLTQVVGNLLHNALKFTDRGGRVSVSLEKDEHQNEAVMRIADTGLGIKPDQLEHLFLPFRQVEGSPDQNQSGLGLGLAIVQGLVEQHGGHVQAASEGPGKGAQFTVRLPLAASVACADMTRAHIGDKL